MTVIKAQNKEAPEGFDQYQAAILHGKMDTLVYFSETVGVKRHALVYLPPGFSPKNLIPYFIFYMESEGMNMSG